MFYNNKPHIKSKPKYNQAHLSNNFSESFEKRDFHESYSEDEDDVPAETVEIML